MGKNKRILSENSENNISNNEGIEGQVDPNFLHEFEEPIFRQRLMQRNN